MHTCFFFLFLFDEKQKIQFKKPSDYIGFMIILEVRRLFCHFLQGPKFLRLSVPPQLRFLFFMFVVFFPPFCRGRIHFFRVRVDNYSAAAFIDLGSAWTECPE